MQVKSNKSEIISLKQGVTQVVTLENARLIAKFLRLGFKSFLSFYNIVTFYHPMYHNATGFIKLQAFWNLNNRDTDFNTTIANILEQLKYD